MSSAAVGAQQKSTVTLHVTRHIDLQVKCCKQHPCLLPATSSYPRWFSSLQALHPMEHAELQAKCEESQRRGTIEANLDQLKGVLAGKGLQGDLSGRPKNLWGVYRKMLQKGYGLDQVYDVRALRVVVESKADCYEMLREVNSYITLCTISGQACLVQL